jgi:hypothetical protein
LNHADREREREEDLHRAVDMISQCSSVSAPIAKMRAQPCLSVVGKTVEHEPSPLEIRLLGRKQRRAERIASECQRPKRPR